MVKIQWTTQPLSTRSPYFSGKLFLPSSSGLCYYLTFTCISRLHPHLFLPSFEFSFLNCLTFSCFFSSLCFVLPSFEFFSHFILFFSSTKKVQCSVSTLWLVNQKILTCILSLKLIDILTLLPVNTGILVNPTLITAFSDLPAMGVIIIFNSIRL